LRRLRGEPESAGRPAIAIRQADGGGRLACYLQQAGYSARVGRLLAVAGGGVGLAALLVGTASGNWNSALLFALFGAVATKIYLGARRARSLRDFEAQLPRAVEMMVFSLRAGHGLEQAVRLASAEVDGPLAAELARCAEESALGRPIEATLHQLQQRWRPVQPLRALVEAVTVLKQTGGNLVEVLQSIAQTLRARATYRGKHRALTADGRLSGALLLVIPLVSLVVQSMVAPEQLREMALNETGRALLGLAGALWLVGGLWVRRLSHPNQG
jgi:tight adherence protein B